MAQAILATAAPISNGVALTAEELREVLEYEKIVRFRDAVLAGTHPRVKTLSATRKTSSPNLSTPQTNRSTSATHNGASSPYSTNNNTKSSPGNYRSAVSGHAIPSKSEINPILLEKSDDLIKAEMQLQRQRLERALREQIEHQRVAAKALLQTSESLPNFDLSEVLSKALAIVHPSTSVDAEPSGDVHSSAGDSFDENTYYSSRHDTPEPSGALQDQGEPEYVPSLGIVTSENASSSTTKHGVQDTLMTVASFSKDNPLASQQLQATQDNGAGAEASQSSNARFNASGGATMATTQHKLTTATDQLLRHSFENHPASPLVRSHDLSPVAPQPARVSPLATTRDPPVPRTTQGAPSQVAVLRQDQDGISSTDSSPQGTKPSAKKSKKERIQEKREKRERKKKRRKSSNENAETPESPYIKPEPTSPSPLGVAPLPRPHKRQRQSNQFAAELNYDEPRYDQTDDIQERIPKAHKPDRDIRTYDSRYEQDARRAQPIYRSYEEDERRASGQYTRRVESPSLYTLPYAPSEVRTVRAPSRTVDRRLEEPVYYRDSRPTIIRAEANRERSRSPIAYGRISPVPMGPPRQRVVYVDNYGREYLEPPTPSRQSVAPPSKYREPEVLYERAPLRTVSARQPMELYDDGYVGSPVPGAPRRVVTQPAYAIPVEHRSYRQREYSVRPVEMGPPGDEYHPREYIRQGTMAPPSIEHRYREPIARPNGMAEPVEEPRQREYSVRAAPTEVYRYREASTRPTAMGLPGEEVYRQREYSVRPATMAPPSEGYTQSRIRPPQQQLEEEFTGRAPSVRPEAVRYEIPREYTDRPTSVRPSNRSPVYAARPSQVVEDYSRGYVAGQAPERYYEEVPVRRPVEATPAFIEQPRAREGSVMVFADDVRRPVYR